MAGRLAERVLARLGFATSDQTVLRLLKARAIQLVSSRTPRVVGIDDWARSKGQSHGTIVVDLEERSVVQSLPDRSSASVANWLACDSGAEFTGHDRHGLYAEGARQGAPNAGQAADRFDLL